jgi:hypothetical protein
MVIKYNLQYRASDPNRNRHALYHFYNTNNRNIPVLTLSPNLFYGNSTLKKKFASPNEKRTRLENLAGGNLKKAATMIRRSLMNRYNEITPLLKQTSRDKRYKNLSNNNINNRFKVQNGNRLVINSQRFPRKGYNMGHWTQFKYYANLSKLVNKEGHYGRQRFSVQPTLNNNLIAKLNNYHKVFTRGIVFPGNTSNSRSKQLQKNNQRRYTILRYGDTNTKIRAIENKIKNTLGKILTMNESRRGPPAPGTLRHHINASRRR